jgi:NADH dehydrogenase FAD-containing subunit
LMAQGSFYSFGPGAADITLVRFPRTAFHHVTERIETRSTDVGASQMIIDGKIKLKNDAQISRFTEKGLEFDDGSTLDADTVVFATGWVKLVHVHPFILLLLFPW